MEDDHNTSNGSVCSIFESYDYVIVAAVSSGSAMVSALCCIFVIGLIFFFKKHHFFIQRLILYHCLVAVLHAMALFLRLHRLGYQTESTAETVLCSISAFLDQVTLWNLVIDFSVITFTLLMTAVFNKNVARLEGLFIVLIFIFPLTFNWIPFINDSYGRAKAWCWIRTLNYSNCTEHRFGIIVQYVLWDVPSYIFLCVVLPTYAVVVVFIVVRERFCFKSKFTCALDQRQQVLDRRVQEEVWPLLFYPIAILLFNTLALINRIYSTVNPSSPSYALWMLQAIVSPLQGGFIALVYVLDCDTRKRLTCSNIKATLMKTSGVEEYPMEVGDFSDTITKNGQSISSVYTRSPV